MYWLLSTHLCVSHSVVSDCDPMDCNPPGSSVHGILQARIQEWVAILFSRGSSQPRIEPGPPVLAGRFFTTEPSGKPHLSGEFFLIYSTQKSFIRYAICKHFLPFYRLYFHLMYEEGLQIAEKRREAKGKGEKERYTHLNAVPKNRKER